jgi:multicomponent Na+:H+ antiporter subunit C
MGLLPYVVSAWLFGVGVTAMVRARNLISLVMALAVTQSSTYVLLLAIGYVNGAAPPIFLSVPSSTHAVDPVVQALTLTDIVVEATVTALLLTFAVRAHQRFGTLDPRKLRALRD